MYRFVGCEIAYCFFRFGIPAVISLTIFIISVKLRFTELIWSELTSKVVISAKEVEGKMGRLVRV